MIDPHVSIRRVDDAIRDYDVLAGASVIGQIRPRLWGTAELHLEQGRYLLRRDDTADAAVKGASTIAQFVRMVLPDARYSLREGDRVLAHARRRFRLSTRGDGLQARVDAAGASQDFTIRAADGAFADLVVFAGDGQRVGRLVSARGRRQFTWQGPALPLPQVVFVLHAAHRHFGRHPHSGN